MNVAAQHTQWDLYVGDVWKIYATIEDEDGNRVDLRPYLADDKVEWSLVNPKTRARVVDIDEVEYEDIDAEHGDILIKVLPVKTATVPSGRYEDVCRLIETDGPRTKWTGAVFVYLGMPPEG